MGLGRGEGAGSGEGAGIGAGLGRGTGFGLGAGAGTGLGGHVRQVVIEFESKVTDPDEASARPCNVELVVIVTLTDARIFPRKVVLVPRVAELPTTQ